MIVALNEEVALAVALPMIMVLTQTIHSMRRGYRTSATARCIMQIAKLVAVPEEPSDGDIRRLRLRFSSSTLIDAAAFVSEHIYGEALYRLSFIVEECEIDHHLLKSIRRATTRQRRVKLLAKLSQLASVSVAAEYSEGYLDEPEQDIRTYATASLIMAHPERAIRYIARLRHNISLHDAAMFAQLMRRAGAPIAYTPLLTSKSRNLQLIGLYLCEHFSIVDAEPLLQQLCESEDATIAQTALFALCTIQGDITTPQVKRAVERLLPHQRDALIRHMVYSCYSLRSCANLLGREERLRFAQRLNSYKCQIVCN
ncbi:MAG: hypothetical protein IKY57_06245 [Alistipes sp.]|nr:hypothetical protein [Alistipes sp.]